MRDWVSSYIIWKLILGIHSHVYSHVIWMAIRLQQNCYLHRNYVDAINSFRVLLSLLTHAWALLVMLILLFYIHTIPAGMIYICKGNITIVCKARLFAQKCHLTVCTWVNLKWIYLPMAFHIIKLHMTPNNTWLITIKPTRALYT